MGAGAGNHYAEIQVVDKIFDAWAAKRMGIEQTGQVCIMIHSGSRGLGHQVATDALVKMEEAMARDNIVTNDRCVASCPSGLQRLGCGLHMTHAMRVVCCCGECDATGNLHAPALTAPRVKTTSSPWRQQQTTLG